MVEVLANEHQLIFGGTFPFIVIQGKALAAEVENVALGAFLKPEDALGPKDRFRQLIIEEILKLANGKGAIAGKGEGGEPVDSEVV